jgi:hypothetical protein
MHPSFGLFRQPIIFFLRDFKEEKLCFSSLKYLTAVRQARNEFSHNPWFAGVLLQGVEEGRADL